MYVLRFGNNIKTENETIGVFQNIYASKNLPVLFKKAEGCYNHDLEKYEYNDELYDLFDIEPIQTVLEC